MPEREAVSKFLKDGDYIGIELYGTVRAPMSLVREIIRQGYRELRCAGQGVYESDLLAAANTVRELDWTYIGFEVYGLSASARRAVPGGGGARPWCNGYLYGLGRNGMVLFAHRVEVAV